MERRLRDRDAEEKEGSPEVQITTATQEICNREEREDKERSQRSQTAINNKHRTHIHIWDILSYRYNSDKVREPKPKKQRKRGATDDGSGKKLKRSRGQFTKNASCV